MKIGREGFQKADKDCLVNSVYYVNGSQKALRKTVLLKN